MAVVKKKAVKKKAPAKRSAPVKAVDKARAKARKMIGDPFGDIQKFDQSNKKKPPKKKMR